MHRFLEEILANRRRRVREAVEREQLGAGASLPASSSPGARALMPASVSSGAQALLPASVSLGTRALLPALGGQECPPSGGAGGRGGTGYGHCPAFQPPPPDPVAAVRGSGGFLIAEVKKASPSKGLIAAGADVAARAREYEEGGAGAVSVLCEPDRFLGSREDVRAAAESLSIPVLCKDFVVDPVQIRWAREDGAKWVLLIARVFGPHLQSYVEEAFLYGLEPLVEVHSEPEMEEALGAGARLIGVNARDLDTFEVDLGVVERLAPLCPPDRACIAESGIRGAEDLLRLEDAGAHGFLIGEALMRSPRPASLLSEFRRALVRGRERATA